MALHGNRMVMLCWGLLNLHLVITITCDDLAMLHITMVTTYMAMHSHACQYGSVCDCHLAALLHQLGMTLLSLYQSVGHGIACSDVHSNTTSKFVLTKGPFAS